MKKSLFVGTVAVAAMLSACTKSEVVTSKDDSITFRTTINGSLKAINAASSTGANALNLTKLQKDGFKVSSYLDGASQLFFDGLEVNYSDPNWNTAKTYYWPSNGTLHFFAYSPKEVNPTITTSEQKITDYAPAKEIANQKDVVVAANKGSRSDNNDGEDAVALNFRHILSNIEIKALCNDDNVKVEVLGVKIGHVNTKGTFTFPTANTTNNQETLTSGWADQKEVGNYFSLAKQNLTLTGDAQRIMFSDNNFMLVPQQLTKWKDGETEDGSYISVLCRISMKNGETYNQIFPATEGKYGFAAVAIDTNWEPGKKYTYTLTFCGEGSGAGRLDPGKNGGLGGESNENVDQTPIPGKPGGTPILKPIKFTVTVDDWDTTADQNINL